MDQRTWDLDTAEDQPELSLDDILLEFNQPEEDSSPQKLVISERPAEDELYFTDRRYEYGAIPSHLNEIENQRIAKAIEEAL